MFVIRKQFKFEMAHQLNQSYSKDCHENLHGHSYVMELFLGSDSLDSSGMVVDFGEVKDVVKQYIDSWDHSLVMPEFMPKEYLDMLGKYTKKFRLTKYNPTAENMCLDMFNQISTLIKNSKIFDTVKVLKVRLHETTTGWAEYSCE